MDPKHQIIKAAVHLIAQKGFAATSIREIAMMASVNISMINYYFFNKNSLLDNILKGAVQKISEKIQHGQVEGQTELEKLFAFIQAQIEYVSQQHEIAKIFFQEELVKNSQAVLEFRQLNYQNFEAIINEGHRKDVFSKTVQPELLYSTIVGTIQQFVVKYLSQNVHANYTLSEEFFNHTEELTAYLKLLCSRMLLK